MPRKKKDPAQAVVEKLNAAIMAEQDEKAALAAVLTKGWNEVAPEDQQIKPEAIEAEPMVRIKVVDPDTGAELPGDNPQPIGFHPDRVERLTDGPHTIPIEWLFADRSNVRVVQAGDAADRDLIASITAHGILQPLGVQFVAGDRECGYEIIWGHRRWACAGQAGLRHVPVLVFSDLTDTQRLALQLVENMHRKDMSEVDQWVAVQRLADEGMSDEQIGLTFNLASRRVAQLRLMGSMHPKIIAAMRETGDFPSHMQAAIVAQAPLSVQEAAIKAHPPRQMWSYEAQKDRKRIPWDSLSTACRLRRVPVSSAAFNIQLYKDAGGKLFHDLFSAEDDTKGEVEDLAVFLKLQNEAMQGMLKKAEGDGWGACVVMPGHSDAAPTNCERHDWKVLGEGKAPPKKERKDWCWSARIKEHDLSVQIRLYRIKKPPVVQKVVSVTDPATGAVTKQSVTMTPDMSITAPAVPDSKLPPLTHAAVEALDKHKRAVAAEAIRQCWDTDKLLQIALFVLADAVSINGSLKRLVNADGTIAWDAAVTAEVAREVLAERMKVGGTQIRTAQRIGAGLAADQSWTVSAELLMGFRANAIERVARAKGLKIGATQTETRGNVLRSAGANATTVKITPQELEELGWRIAPLVDRYGYDAPKIEDHPVEAGTPAAEAQAEAAARDVKIADLNDRVAEAEADDSDLPDQADDGEPWGSGGEGGDDDELPEVEAA